MRVRTLVCDGGLLGTRNPSPEGVYCSVAELDRAGTVLQTVRRDYLDYHTNNDAEWLALINALDLAAQLPDVDVTVIKSDSQLIVQQVTGQWAITSDALRLFREMAARVQARIPGRVVFRWHPRKDSVAALGH